MRSSDIRSKYGPIDYECQLGELIERVEAPGRANWSDIPVGSGIYVVYLPDHLTLHVSPPIGQDIYTCRVPAEDLLRKWHRTNIQTQTDILYIGKGDNLRDRIRQLVRFGVRKAQNHGGGKCMWQVTEIRSAILLAKTCPPDEQATLEYDLLQSFYHEHGDWSLANWNGGSSGVNLVAQSKV